MKRAVYRVSAFLALGVSLAPGQNAIHFSGIDVGVGPADARPNASRSLALFDASASLVGDRIIRILDFETVNLGLFLNLSPAESGVAGLSILPAAQSSGIDTSITDQLEPVAEGFNTTTGGSRFLKIEEDQPGPGVEPPVGVTFQFATPVRAFGATITGADPGVLGAIRATFDNGQPQTVLLDGAVGGGAQFWGFTSESDVTSVTIFAAPEVNVGTDAIGIDDVRWVQVPEPALPILVLLGSLGLMARRRSC